jgi:simple sugar transport system permease protein
VNATLAGLFESALAVAAVAAVVALALLGLALAGYPAGEVCATWLAGAGGSPLRWAISVQYAGPLLLTGLATAIAFRCGVLNIGAEGQYLVGAVALVATAARCHGPPWLVLPVALLAAVAAGALWALVAAALERRRGVPVVLSTILLNFVAVAAVGILVEGPLHDPATTAPQTALIDEGLHLPVLVAGSKLHLGVALAFALAAALWVVQRQTGFGFELRAVGLNPLAARLAGMPVAARQLQVMALSGGLAGLAGGLQLAGVTYFMSSTTVSYGYAGIAVALLGRLHPLGVAAAAVFFGMLDTGAGNLERRMGIPHDLGDVVKGLVVLAVLFGGALAARWRARAAPAVPVAPIAPAAPGGGAHDAQ